MDCIILAGGFGTRLKNIVSDVPKPLAPIGGRPFLEILLKQIEKAKIIDRVIFALSYKAEMIIQYLAKRENKFDPIFVKEDNPLGTGGAIQQCIKSIKSTNFFVMNGDSYLEIDWIIFFQSHQVNKAYVTIACTNISDSARFGTVKISQDHRIIDFHEKTELSQPGLINGGIYCFKKGYLPYHSVGDNFSVEKELFPKLIDKNIYAYLAKGLFIDIGTADSYNQAQKKLLNL